VADAFATGGSIAQANVLYQEARWPASARLLYGPVLAAFWLLAARDVVWPASTRAAGLYFSAGVALLTAAVEWRARKMGVIVTPDELVLVRALNRTHIKWADIDDFQPVAFGIWGEQRVRVKRHRRLGAAAPAAPTLILTPTRSWWTWWFRPARLRAAGALEGEPLDFLRELLQSRRGELEQRSSR